MRSGFEDRNENDPNEVSRLAIELFAKDQERKQEEQATQSALQEMSVPPEYLETAKRTIEQRQALEARASNNKRIVKLILAPFLILALFFLSSVAYRALQPPPKPYAIDFEKMPWAQWAVDLNTSSVAKADVLKDQKGSYARIDVEKFAYTKRDFWVGLTAHKGPYDMARHREIHFRARSNGLPALRLRFITEQFEYRSPTLALTKDWQDYTVDLNQLEEDRRVPGSYEYMGPGHRIADEIDFIKVDTGAYVNPIESKGTIDIGGLTVQ
jgi:hypothetical protein